MLERQLPGDGPKLKLPRSFTAAGQTCKSPLRHNSIECLFGVGSVSRTIKPADCSSRGRVCAGHSREWQRGQNRHAACATDYSFVTRIGCAIAVDWFSWALLRGATIWCEKLIGVNLQNFWEQSTILPSKIKNASIPNRRNDSSIVFWRNSDFGGKLTNFHPSFFLVDCGVL